MTCLPCTLSSNVSTISHNMKMDILILTNLEVMVDETH